MTTTNEHMTTVINTNSTIDAYYDRYPVVDQIYSTGRTGATNDSRT